MVLLCLWFLTVGRTIRCSIQVRLLEGSLKRQRGQRWRLPGKGAPVPGQLLCHSGCRLWNVHEDECWAGLHGVTAAFSPPTPFSLSDTHIHLALPLRSCFPFALKAGLSQSCCWEFHYYYLIFNYLILLLRWWVCVFVCLSVCVAKLILVP